MGHRFDGEIALDLNGLGFRVGSKELLRDVTLHLKPRRNPSGRWIERCWQNDTDPTVGRSDHTDIRDNRVAWPALWDAVKC